MIALYALTLFDAYVAHIEGMASFLVGPNHSFMALLILSKTYNL